MWGGEVVDDGCSSPSDQGGGVGEEGGGGGEGATLQTLGSVHLETPVQGGQQQLLVGGESWWLSDMGGLVDGSVPYMVL